MNNKIDALKKTRQSLLGFISELTTEQLNEIPAGFVNNIAWNVGHLVASQQGMCYGRGGLPLNIADDFFHKYKPGTQAESFISTSEIEEIKKKFLELPDQFAQDHEQDLFANYTPWTNRYGIEMTGIDDTMTFVLFHEGLHLGYIMALKRSLQQ